MKERQANGQKVTDGETAGRASRTTTLRILELIELVCRETSNEVADLSAKLDIPQPTVYRQVDSLVEAGFLARDPAGKLTPGARIRGMLFDSLQNEPAVARRRAVLNKLMLELEETVSLSGPYGLELYYFDRIEYNWPVAYRLGIGDRLPILGSASGLVFLSTLDPEQAMQIVRDQRDATKPASQRWETKLLSDLGTIREQGYALDDEIFLRGMIGAAVPILDRAGTPKAFLSTHGLKLRRDMDKMRAEIPLMQEAAARLTEIFFPKPGAEETAPRKIGAR